MDGATAMSHSSPGKLHPVAPFSNLESQVPAVSWGVGSKLGLAVPAQSPASLRLGS